MTKLAKTSNEDTKLQEQSSSNKAPTDAGVLRNNNKFKAKLNDRLKQKQKFLLKLKVKYKDGDGGCGGEDAAAALAEDESNQIK